MSLLDTFKILFETDADEAAKSVDGLDKGLDKTEKSGKKATESLKATGVAADSVTDAFVDMAKGIAGVVAAYVGLEAIKEGMIDAANEADNLGKFTQALGLNAQEIDAWGEAAARNGGSADAFRGSIAGLQSQLTSLSITGDSQVAETLARIGISAVDTNGHIKSSIQVIKELSTQFEGMSKQQSFQLGSMLGLDKGTILLLQQGSVAVGKLVDQEKQLGGYTKAAYNASANFHDATDDLNRVFTSLFMTLDAMFLPILTDVINGIKDAAQWMRSHKDFAEAFFITLATAATAVALPAIVSVAGALAALIAPVAAVVAAIVAVAAAIGLVYDDVKHYMNGQDSLIGRAAKKFKWFGKLVDFTISAVKASIAELEKFSSEIWQDIQNGLDGLGKAFSWLWGIVKDVLSALGVNLGSFNSVASEVVDAVINNLKMLGQSAKDLLEFIASPIQSTKELFSGLGGYITEHFGGAIKTVSGIVKSEFDFIIQIIKHAMAVIKHPIETIENLTDAIGDKVSGLFDRAKASIGLGDNGYGNSQPGEASAAKGGPVNYLSSVSRNSERMLSTINTYNSSPINTYSSSSSSRTENHYHITTGPTRIDARGMTPQEAQQLITEQQANNLGDAIAQNDDGEAY